MRRAIALAAGGALAAAVLVPSPAGANTPSGTANAQAANGTAVVIAPGQPSGSGVLGSIVAATLQTVINTLTGLVDQQLGGPNGLVTNLVNSTSGNAAYPGGPSSYSGAGPLAVPGLLSLNLGTPSGSASGDATGTKASSQLTSAGLQVLGLDLLDTGLVKASATCPATGSPSATYNFDQMSLLSGGLTLSLANGTNAVQVAIGGGTPIPLSQLNVPVQIIAGLPVTLSADGSLLHVKVGIGIDQLLSIPGLNGLLSALSGVVDTSGTNLYLTLTVGPGQTSASSTQAGAWGLEVGVDLSGTLSISVLSVLGILGGSATATIPSGIDSGSASYGNMLDLKLGYAACTNGTNPTAYPPGLI